MDRIKNELYKAMGKSSSCMKGLCQAMNSVLDEGRIKEEWKVSKTRMIPKIRRPQVKDHRPIALTNVGYKLFMSVMKGRMVQQELNDLRVKNMQAGFTEGRRLGENLFMLQYIVEECYRRKRELFVISVDFCKAFDSVDRGALVEALMFHKCDLRMIEVLVNLYCGDQTVIFREGKEMGRTEVKCGIRQGCTGSPQLFVMVVNMLVERMVKSGLGYESDMMRVPVLFYADDGLMFARDRREAERMLELIESYGQEYGLRINRGKSACMMFNVGDGVQEDRLGGVE